METLAYLHLVLANETAADTEYTALIYPFERRILAFKSTNATIQFFGLTVALLLFGMANQAMALVQEGDRSSDVTFIQQRLQQLGYFQGNITGYFGSMTKQAVMRFQEAKGLTADGMVGTNTQASLQSPQKENQAVKPVQPRENQASVKAASQETRPILLQIGDRGAQVSILQEGLAAAGFSSGTNGVFDAATHEAVKQFQQAKGLSVDGIVGAQTRAALPAIGGQNPTFTAINPPKPAEIKAMQKRLQARGFYGGTIDGLWGPQTQAAVESAQKAYSVSIEDLPNHGF